MARNSANETHHGSITALGPSQIWVFESPRLSFVQHSQMHTGIIQPTMSCKGQDRAKLSEHTPGNSTPSNNWKTIPYGPYLRAITQKGCLGQLANILKSMTHHIYFLRNILKHLIVGWNITVCFLTTYKVQVNCRWTIQYGRYLGAITQKGCLTQLANILKSMTHYIYFLKNIPKHPQLGVEGVLWWDFRLYGSSKSQMKNPRWPLFRGP